MNTLEINSFHGTNEKGEKDILSSNFKIRIPVIMNRSTKKLPGSLGYGFYTFKDGLSNPKELAYEFSNKFNDQVVVLKIISSISEDTILDLNNSDSKNEYRLFYNKTLNSAKYTCKTKGFNINNRKQHVLDGVILELYVQYLKSRKHIIVNGIIHDTVTAIKNEGFSDIENSREFCIRDNAIIKDIIIDV